jgi:hypothetical protein
LDRPALFEQSTTHQLELVSFALRNAACKHAG